MLKRSIFYYALVAILLFMTNFDVIHKQRGGYLWYLYHEAEHQKSIPATIHYLDYLRRLDPADITIWQDLVQTYLTANEPVKARETALLALRVTPRDSKNYPLLLALYDSLRERSSP